MVGISDWILNLSILIFSNLFFAVPRFLSYDRVKPSPPLPPPSPPLIRLFVVQKLFQEIHHVLMLFAGRTFHYFCSTNTQKITGVRPSSRTHFNIRTNPNKLSETSLLEFNLIKLLSPKREKNWKSLARR